MEPNLSPETNARPERPALLSLLCILTFIVSGLAVLVSLAGIFSSGWLLEQAEPLAPGILDYSKTAIILLFLTLLVVWTLALWGSILMFCLRKSGFILFLIPAGLLLIFQLILTISAFNIYFLLFDLLCVLIIVLFATQVKHMKG